MAFELDYKSLKEICSGEIYQPRSNEENTHANLSEKIEKQRCPNPVTISLNEDYRDSLGSHSGSLYVIHAIIVFDDMNGDTLCP